MSELLAAALAVLDALPTTPEAIQAGDTAELNQLVETLETHIACYRTELILVGDRSFERFGASSAVIVVEEYTRALILVMSNKPDDFVARTTAGRTRGFRDNLRDQVPREVRRLEEYLEAVAPSETQQQPEQPTIYYHASVDDEDRSKSSRAYSMTGRGEDTRIVSLEEHNLLQAFARTGRTMETKELETAGVSNVSRVVAQLNQKFNGLFAPAVRLPEAKGDGYFIRVAASNPE
jgi:hypothetical protein